MTYEEWQLARRKFWADMYRYYRSQGSTALQAGAAANEDVIQFDERWAVQL